MSHDQLGSEPAVTSDFDLSIDNTGDIQTVSGVGCLSQDLAILFHHHLDDIRGIRARSGVLTDIEVYATELASYDPRIEGVRSVVAYVTDSDELMIELDLQTVEGDVQTVINAGDI